MGYLLSNGVCGVYFNDNTKIVLHPDNYTIEYFEKSIESKKEQKALFGFKSYPPALKKKVTLLVHFKNMLEGNPNKGEVPAPNFSKSLNGENLTHLKKWMRTRHAILFRLSNKIVQVTFEDGSEIVMSSTNKKVSYLNKMGERTNYLL